MMINRKVPLKISKDDSKFEFKNEDVLCLSCQTVIGKTLTCRATHCSNCEKIERLKGIVCPCCKGTNLDEGGIYQSNGVFGPGHHSRNTFPHLSCNDCGVIFKKIKA